jgi:single-stranded-DNA-specific exonuclease
VGKRRSDDVSAADLGFTVGPRLNAAGRLDDMSLGIRCLLSDDANEAATLAARLDRLNRERREIEADMQATALAAVRQLREPAQREARAGVVLYDPGWHQGVVGLVASRIKEKLRRPVVAFADANNGELRGSARSIAGVHIRDVLDAMACRDPELISRFGGHAMAAGLTLPSARLDQFAQAFDREVRACLGAALDADCIATDGELELEAIALTTAAALRAGGPWGQAFPEPSFDGEFRVRRWRVVGERHLKMWVEPKGSGRQFDAIAFNYFDDMRAGQSVPDELQLVYRLDINEYAGEQRLQLLVEHVIDASSATMPPP